MKKSSHIGLNQWNEGGFAIQGSIWGSVGQIRRWSFVQGKNQICFCWWRVRKICRRGVQSNLEGWCQIRGVLFLLLTEPTVPALKNQKLKLFDFANFLPFYPPQPKKEKEYDNSIRYSQTDCE